FISVFSLDFFLVGLVSFFSSTGVLCLGTSSLVALFFLVFASSTSFSNKNVAEDICYKILSDENNKIKINKWLSDSKGVNKLVLDSKGIKESLIGIGIKRGESSTKNMYNGMIVLKKDGKSGYYILTGYPIE
ncbi:MAG: RNase A-like domain-containing protein, partial [Sarcina sp.]